MDKNASKDTLQFIAKYGWNLLPIISTVTGWLIKQAFSVDFWLTWIFVFLGIVIIIHIVNEIRWATRRKKGFVNICLSPDDDAFTEHEKSAWLGFSLKDEAEKIKLHVIIRRVTHGKELGLSNLSFVGNGAYVLRDLVLEDYVKEVPIMSIAEDHAFIMTDNGKRDLRIFLDEQSTFSLEKCELFFEIKGRINEKYIFSEFYKGTIVYQCSTDPNVFVGQSQEPHRSSQMKWESFDKWSWEDENIRPLIREMRNLADRME